jgi:hypothetical protein
VTAPVRYSPAGWFAGEAEHLINDAGDKDRYMGAADREADALRGIGYALLAIACQLGDGNDESAGIAAHLEQLAMTADDLAAPAPRRVRWPWRRRPAPATADIAAGRLPAVPMNDEDVLSALAGIWSGGAWARLEICRPGAGGYAGYCVPVTGPRVLTADALADPAACPDSIAELAALLSASGWQRLEIIGDPAGGRPYGWCEPADGTVVSLTQVLERAVSVPGITVSRYAAPQVSITRVTRMISPEPAEGRHRPGHYQRFLLNTRTGELSFHESTEHLEPRDPSWTENGVPRQMWNRWHPGTLFLPYGGPHMWFEPVPELLSWVIDSGTPAFPYLDAGAANALLEELAWYAQALLNWLFDTAGELDWSADSVRAGRGITRLCSRDPMPRGGNGDGLADYADIVCQLPQVYRPELLSLPPDKLTSECESITRFLGCSEHWHPEVREVFGGPYADGTGWRLDVLGVRAWYRTAAGLAVSAR